MDSHRVLHCLLKSLILLPNSMKPSLIREIHSYVRNALRRRGPIPDEMKERVAGKEYPRMEQIVLPPVDLLDMKLVDTLKQRRSSRDFTLHTPVSVKQLGSLLGLSLGKTASNRERPYPSGGGLYPLETYVIVNSIQGLNRGVYHYEPQKHVLEYLWDLPAGIQIGSVIPAGPWVSFASCAIVFTCVWERSRKKYDDFSYLLSLIESGGAGQNIALVGTALGVGTCSVAGFDEVHMQHALDLPPGEQPLYTIVIGTQNPTV